MADPARVAAAYALRAQLLTPSVAKGVRLAGFEAIKLSKAAMNRLIYAHPIPLRKNGKPEWIRNRSLYKEERLVFEDQGLTARLVNTVRYAEIRHEMGKTTPRLRKKTRWPAPWREVARDQMRAANRKAIREGWLAAMTAVHFDIEQFSSGDRG